MWGHHHHDHHARSGRGCAPRGGDGTAGGGFGGRFGGAGERGFGGGGYGGGGRARRLFDSGDLRLVLLKLIADEPRHGYDLIRAIEARTGGGYAPSPGIIYPTITMLEDMSLIAEQPSEGAKRRFAATAEGDALLAERAGDVAALFDRLDAIGQIARRTDATPIRRAMHNLKNVLQQKLGAEEVAIDRLHAITALIDEAAQKIERL